MYFCVAAACLFELMFIVRAPGRTWPGAWVSSAYTGKHIVVVMLLSAINGGGKQFDMCPHCMYRKAYMLSAIKRGGKQFDLCPDRQTTSCSGSP